MPNESLPPPSGLLTGYPKKFFKDFIGDYDTITEEQFNVAKEAWMNHCRQWRADNPPSSVADAILFPVDTPPLEKVAPTQKWANAGRAGGVLLIIYLLTELFK